MAQKSPAKAVMIQSTGSGVGKSVLVAALCQVFMLDMDLVCEIVGLDQRRRKRWIISPSKREA